MTSRSGLGKVVPALAPFLFLTLAEPAVAQAQDIAAGESAPSTLDLSDFELTFADEFDSLSISSTEDATWYPRTPWYGDFGEARFAEPGQGGPFSLRDGNLVITVDQIEPGRWQSGLISSMNPDGRGFAQQYGYFETRMRVPTGEGVWPAFWLIGAQRLQGRGVSAEIDIMEHYGAWPNRFSMKWHEWGVPSADGGDGHNWDYTHVYVEDGNLGDGWHTYGALIDERTITYYFNGREVWSAPTPDIHHQPMMVLVNLALGGGWPVDPTLDDVELLVDYVRVYQRRS